jgi:hypothetical protein
MTDAQIIARFEALWAVGMKKPEGAQMWPILQQVAQESGKPVGTVRQLMLDSTFAGGAG